MWIFVIDYKNLFYLHNRCLFPIAYYLFPEIVNITLQFKLKKAIFKNEITLYKGKVKSWLIKFGRFTKYLG